MCKYCDCNKINSLYFKENGQIQEIYIEPDKTLTILTNLSEESVNIDIKYCPMCGEKL